MAKSRGREKRVELNPVIFHTQTDQGMGHRGHRVPTQRRREAIKGETRYMPIDADCGNQLEFGSMSFSVNSVSELRELCGPKILVVRNKRANPRI